MKLIRITLSPSNFYGKDREGEKYLAAREGEKYLAARADAVRLANELQDYGVVFTEPDADDTYPSFLNSPELLLSPDEYADFCIRRIPISEPTYLKTKDADDGDPFIAVIAKMNEVLAMRSAGGDVNYNSRCEVSMPGQALSIYNETLLKEDCCTDELQCELLAGWRIIAACPQPDQRRPDYILGRFNPEMDV